MSVKMMSESWLRSLTCVILSQWSPRCWCMDLDRVRGSSYAVISIVKYIFMIHIYIYIYKDNIYEYTCK